VLIKEIFISLIDCYFNDHTGGVVGPWDEFQSKAKKSSEVGGKDCIGVACTVSDYNNTTSSGKLFLQIRLNHSTYETKFFEIIVSL